MKGRKHKFRVTSYSKVSNWKAVSIFKSYATAVSFKKLMEKANFRCILSIL